MGTSTDAKLIYGIPLEDDSFELYDEDDPDAKREGPGWLAWMGREEDGVTIESHCSDEYPMYFVAIEACTITAWRGHPKNVTDKDMRGTPDRDKKLLEFCYKYKLRTTGKPGWYLASWWG